MTWRPAHTPLAVWALAAVLGGQLGWLLPGPWGTRAVVVGIIGLLPAAAAPGRPALGAVAGAVAVTVVVAGLTASRLEALTHGPLAELARSGGRAEVTATVVAEPRPSEDGWWTLVRVDSLDGQRIRQRALWRGQDAMPVDGARFAGTVMARPLGVSAYDDYLRSRHVAVRIDPIRWQHTHDPGAVGSALEWVRARLRNVADRALGGDRAGLAVGFVTGDIRHVSHELKEQMRGTGLSHLTAVSGANVAIVLGGTLAGAAAMGVGARGRRRMALVVLIFFAILTKLAPSVLRASVMAGAVLLGQARGLRVDPVSGLAGAVLILVLIDPLMARSLGLLLSAAGTAGVVVLAPLVGRRLHRLPRFPRALVAVSVGAQIAVAPVLLTTGGEVPAASVPANLVAVPARAVASTILMVGSVIALVAPTLAVPVFALAGAPVSVVATTARAFAGRGPAVSGIEPLVVLAVAAGCAWLLSQPRSGQARRWGALACAVLAVTMLPTPAAAPVRTLTVTAIDVGQGDAFLVETPGARILIDGGPDEQAAADWLRRTGRGRLDLVVLSHPHLDHLAGLPSVVEQSDVGALWWRPLPEPPAALEALRYLTASRGIPVYEPVAGEVARVGDATIEVLGPPAGPRPYAWSDSEANDTSLVLRVGWRGRRVLLTGDAERAAQQALLRRPDLLRADVLKVPHHGGATTEPDFLRASGARVAFIGVGEDNSYGHPSRTVLDLLAELGATIHRTDLDGTVSVQVLPASGQPPAALPDRQDGSIDSPHVRLDRPGRRRRPPHARPPDRAHLRRLARRATRPRDGGLRRRRARPPARDADRHVVRRPSGRGDPTGPPSVRRGATRAP